MSFRDVALKNLLRFLAVAISSTLFGCHIEAQMSDLLLVELLLERDEYPFA